MQVRIGDLVSFDASPVAMVAGNSLAGKSLDHIAPAWPRWLSVLRSLPLFATGLIFISVASVQEEVGLRGAITAGLRPGTGPGGGHRCYSRRGSRLAPPRCF